MPLSGPDPGVHGVVRWRCLDLCEEVARCFAGQKGSLTYDWAPVGSRPPMVRDNRNDTAYLFGAICPARGVGAAIITPTANTECMNLHLQEISTRLTPGSIAVLTATAPVGTRKECLTVTAG